MSSVLVGVLRPEIDSFVLVAVGVEMSVATGVSIEGSTGSANGLVTGVLGSPPPVLGMREVLDSIFVFTPSLSV